MWLSLSLYTLLVIDEFAKFDIIKITDNSIYYVVKRPY